LKVVEQLNEIPRDAVMKANMSRYSGIRPSERLPEWLRRPIGNASAIEQVQTLVKQNGLNTICEEGRCPNRGECYAAGTATFLLGGSICTRSCAFCQVEKGRSPEAVNPEEGERVAEAVLRMGLRYVVLTAVARDDLEDHGASLFTNAMAAIRARNPLIAIEVLTPDFWGGVADQTKALRSSTAASSQRSEGRARLFQPQSRNGEATSG
jgi:lipoic acid synthetase